MMKRSASAAEAMFERRGVRREFCEAHVSLKDKCAQELRYHTIRKLFSCFFFSRLRKEEN
jgi:hypothetical protein